MDVSIGCKEIAKVHKQVIVPTVSEALLDNNARGPRVRDSRKIIGLILQASRLVDVKIV